MEEPVAPRPTGKAPGETGSGYGDDGPDDSKNKKKPNPSNTNRKRTKTGCLTCRKRRIKCDEGRPTCNNCIKSKRLCEGYNQRVIFKDPIGAHPFSGPFGPYGYMGTAHPLSQLASQQARASGRGSLPTIAPRPPAPEYLNQHHNHSLQYNLPYPPGVPVTSHAHPGAFDLGGIGSIQTNAYVPQPNPLLPADIPATFEQPPQLYNTHRFQQGIPNHQSGLPAYVHSETNRLSGNLGHALESPVPPTVLGIAPVHEDSSDENASMADSDEGELSAQALMAPVLLGSQRHDARNASVRLFSSYAGNHTLNEYMGAPYATELRDAAKRKLFEHFMRVTGPSISLYERNAFENSGNRPTLYATDGRSHIWSHTFPLMALQHPALLHAMLGLASLQVSKLQKHPATAAIKHYHIALRRVAKNVGSTLKRLHPATLAATLVLAYFEVWNSEHNKWCSHLYGARQLIAEIPLRRMGKRCLPARSLRDRQEVMKRMGLAGIGGPLPRDPKALDYGLLSTLTGYHITPEDYDLGENQIFQNPRSSPTEKDIEDFENLCDLYWWYCKMDVYQAILGGTKLFMDYHLWTQIPPRSPFSRLNASYGSYDHLMLLLARLTTFAFNDLPRKRKSTQQKAPAGGSPPPFVGMFPTMGTVRPPMGFSPPEPQEDGSETSDEQDPQESYRAALHEWNNIKHAFEVFEAHLTNEFKPLSSEYTDRRDEPFGPAIQYRTYTIAGTMMNYYMGLIILQRCHPDMPPTAMQSVGSAARKTAVYANVIGRIAVGLSDDTSRMTEISTVMAAAHTESSFPIFVAAIQYQDDNQRVWVVRRLHDITRLTGWQSARQIADGCESSWNKAAQFGRGPLYLRPEDLDDVNPSIWMRPRRIDRVLQEADQSAGTETRLVLAGADRAHFALGLLGVEDDFQHLELKDDTFNRDKAVNI